MNRRRGVHTLPIEFQTDEKLASKKEMAERRSLPACPPVPNKMRRYLASANGKSDTPKAISYKKPVELSPLYDPSLKSTYFEQLFSVQEQIGEGSFGKVYRVQNRADNELYAVKRLKSTISWSDRYAEVRNNEKVEEHPNCVRFYMAWEEGCDVYMLLECCDMSLSDFSHQNFDIPEEMLMNVLYDICTAFEYLHKKDLLHLDVKPDNIMMKKGYYKLGDFGILVDLTLPPKICKSTLSDGDAKYLAPEVLNGVYKPACDIFGLGISLLELASGLELPNNGPLWQQLRHEVLPHIFYDSLGVSLGFKVIIEKMLKPKYEERPAAAKILKYGVMRAIGKRDKKSPRIDYLAGPEDEQRNLEQADLEVENVFATPPCSNVRPVIDPADYLVAPVVEYPSNGMGRKNLFNSEPADENINVVAGQINPDKDAKPDPDKDAKPKVEQGDSNSVGQLACKLNDSEVSMDVDEARGSANSSPLDLICHEVLTSTPVLKVPIVPSRLSFD